MTDWLPMAGGDDRLSKAERWLNCCADRIINANEAYLAAKAELAAASEAFDAAKREFDRIEFVQGVTA